MTPESFDFLAGFLKARSGLVLSAGKQYLLEHRLGALLRGNGIGSIDALASLLETGAGPAIETAFVEAMTTNETFFYRDKAPFEYFEQHMVPNLAEARAGSRQLAIWCAAASAGQEPYSLAMSLLDLADMIGDWTISIIASDLSAEILEKARSGLYSQFEVQRGLPIKKLLSHFCQIGELWQIAPTLRAMVDFRAMNLLDNFSHLRKFDIIFCRNVLMYFDQDTKRNVLARMAAQMAPDGFLVLGAAETVIGVSDRLKPVAGCRGVYALTDAAKHMAMPVRALAASASAAPSPVLAAPGRLK